ncbi:MAG: hypothetical protein WB463_18450, partial [Pseudolabrys sp.]
LDVRFTPESGHLLGANVCLMPEADIGANIRARKRKTVLGVSPKSKRLLRWPEQSYRIEAYRHCRFGPIERRFCPRVWLRI